jgi:hypothetical protein
MMTCLTLAALLTAGAQAAAPAPAPAAEPVFHDRVPARAWIYIEEAETMDASNTRNPPTYGDFGVAIAAALAKKKVPVMVVTDPDRAEFIIRHTSSAREEGTAAKIARIAVLGTTAGSSHFNASIMVVEKASTGVLFSYNVKKGNFQSAAEAFAKHLKNHIEGKE